MDLKIIEKQVVEDLEDKLYDGLIRESNFKPLKRQLMQYFRYIEKHGMTPSQEETIKNMVKVQSFINHHYETKENFLRYFLGEEQDIKTNRKNRNRKKLSKSKLKVYKFGELMFSTVQITELKKQGYSNLSRENIEKELGVRMVSETYLNAVKALKRRIDDDFTITRKKLFEFKKKVNKSHKDGDQKSLLNPLILTYKTKPQLEQVDVYEAFLEDLGVKVKR